VLIWAIGLVQVRAVICTIDIISGLPAMLASGGLGVYEADLLVPKLAEDGSWRKEDMNRVLGGVGTSCVKM
jgi:hypothetical protein